MYVYIYEYIYIYLCIDREICICRQISGILRAFECFSFFCGSGWRSQAKPNQQTGEGVQSVEAVWRPAGAEQCQITPH